MLIDSLLKKQKVAAKFGINEHRFLGFGYTKFAYKFGYNWKCDFEAGAAMAFGISSPGNYSQSFIEASQNRAGIFGILNSSPGYFFTLLTSKSLSFLSVHKQRTIPATNRPTTLSREYW
jgi:hypothetical protein